MKTCKCSSEEELIDKKQCRREFLRNFTRYLILGGLVFIGVLLGKRSLSSAAEKISFNICGDCSILTNCELPPALLARKALKK